MNYNDYDSTNEADTTPWGAAPATYTTEPVYDGRSTQLVSVPHPLVVNAAPVSGNGALTANSSALATASPVIVLGSLIQSVQQTQNRQMYLLRDLDARLVRMENAMRPEAAEQRFSFERTTWWAIWGLLMLILGGALAVMILLIAMRISLR